MYRVFKKELYNDIPNVALWRIARGDVKGTQCPGV
jgi:hypothetical protein